MMTTQIEESKVSKIATFEYDVKLVSGDIVKVMADSYHLYEETNVYNFWQDNEHNEPLHSFLKEHVVYIRWNNVVCYHKPIIFDLHEL